ncbi:MAG: flagellar basal body P-ring formation chaperone FlgA [Paracoccaceae bacterium]|uniref:flagellar basal body P-ring formation chaperone FlgA n=1 Tax=Shimia thalassica TaxID=1715693 RepID=UPI003296FDCD
MIRVLSIFLVTFSSFAALADIVVPTRTIRANAVITEVDVGTKAGGIANAFEHVSHVIGQEARKTLYAGRPILVDDIGPPALVTRNQIVSLRFIAGGLVISTEGRSLERGGIGDRVRIMNLASRTTLFGQIQPDGSVQVKN